VLESDLAYVQDYSASNITKVKKLLGVIAASAPFEPNVSKIAEKLNLGRNTVTAYLKHLADAKVLNLLNKPTKGTSFLQKPDKVYFENTCFARAFQPDPNAGTLRETFFLNQLSNAGHKINLPAKGDFLVDEKWTFEVGGKNKAPTQIRDLADGYLALEGIEVGFSKKIPLWMFGLLY
jgi:predicted AAA+ superfamily ATPase